MSEHHDDRRARAIEAMMWNRGDLLRSSAKPHTPGVEAEPWGGSTIIEKHPPSADLWMSPVVLPRAMRKGRIEREQHANTWRRSSGGYLRGIWRLPSTPDSRNPTLRNPGQISCLIESDWTPFS